MPESPRLSESKLEEALRTALAIEECAEKSAALKGVSQLQKALDEAKALLSVEAAMLCPNSINNRHINKHSFELIS